MLIRTTYVDSIVRGDETIVRVRGRAESGESVVRYVTGLCPQFFVPRDADVSWAVQIAADQTDGEYDPVRDVVDRDDGGEFVMYDGRPATRVRVDTPGDVSKLVDTDVFEWTGEADVPMYRQVTMFYGLSGYLRVPGHKTRCRYEEIETDVDSADVSPISPRVCVADIEVEVKPGQSFVEMQESAENEVIALTFYDTAEEDYFLGIIDPEGRVDPSAMKGYLRDHWGDHDMAPQMTEPDCTLLQTESETDLLARFIKEVRSRDFDLLSGWNWVGFDHEYLLDRLSYLDTFDRFDRYDVDPSDLSTLGLVQRWKVARAIEGLPGFDQMDAYTEKMSFSEWRSKSLEYVASEELGVGKVDHPGIMEDYETNRSRLAAYNLIDVQLCVALTETFGIEEFFYQLADMSGIQITDTFSELRLVDGYMLSRRTNDEVLPTQEERDIRQPAGGLVLSPSDGIQDYVGVFDLTSLYPSCMITANISAETMVTDPSEADLVVPAMPVKEDDCGGTITEDDIGWDLADGAFGFTLDQQGIQPQYNRLLFADRNEKKGLRNQYDPASTEYDVFDRQQASVKVVMNSAYGVSNSDYYRLARDGVGDAITALGRYTLWTGAQVCAEMGYEVIYGDTDSVFIQLADPSEDVDHDELLRRGAELEAELNDRMTGVADAIGVGGEHPYIAGTDLHGTERHALTFEFEKLYERFFQAGSKKRYAGHIVWKEGKDVDDLDVTGFESQRADVPEVTADVQEAVIKMVLEGAGFEEVSAYLREKIAAIESDDIDPQNIGVPLALNKELDSYGNIRRARAARFSNAHLGSEFGIGDTPWVRFIQRTPIGVPDTDVIALEWHEDIPEGYPVDIRETVDKAFESALNPILGEAGWTYNEVRSGRRNQAVGSDTMMDYSGDPFAGTATVETTDGSTNTDDDEDGGWAW